MTLANIVHETQVIWMESGLHVIKPRYEKKNCLRGLRPVKTQIGVLRYKS